MNLEALLQDEGGRIAYVAIIESLAPFLWSNKYSYFKKRNVTTLKLVPQTIIITSIYFVSFDRALRPLMLELFPNFNWGIFIIKLFVVVVLNILVTIIHPYF